MKKKQKVRNPLFLSIKKVPSISLSSTEVGQWLTKECAEAESNGLINQQSATLGF
jgi:hypothetical protein